MCWKSTVALLKLTKLMQSKRFEDNNYFDFTQIPNIVQKEVVQNADYKTFPRFDRGNAVLV